MSATVGTCEPCRRTATVRTPVTVGREVRLMCPVCAARWAP